MSAETVADWCEDVGDIVICGTRMTEHSRKSEGIKWCFHCRRRFEFEHVVMVPDGISYYGPYGFIECSNCKTTDGDVFPGWSRTWGHDDE